MNARRISPVELGLSLELRDVWQLPALAPAHEGLGIHLLHLPTAISLNVRTLDTLMTAAEGTLQEKFASYLAVSWPGAEVTISAWEVGALAGLTAVMAKAMREAVVREWLVTNGRAFANAATFATAAQWPALLPDCESLVRSIRF